MLFTILLLICLAAMFISLFTGLFFLLKDKGKKKRLVYALFIRVSLALIVLILIVYAMMTGRMTPHSPIGLAPKQTEPTE